MRTDEIAPRVALTQEEPGQPKNWSLVNPAFGGIGAALVAGLYAESAFQSYASGSRFHEWWRGAVIAGGWLVMAVIAVVRGLNRPSQ
jgi:hypothetical protein